MSGWSGAGALIGFAGGMAALPAAFALTAQPPFHTAAAVTGAEPAPRWPAAVAVTGTTTITGLRPGPLSALPAALVFAAGLTILGVSDWRFRLLPKRIVYPLWAAGLLLLLLPASLHGDWTALARSVAGGGGLMAAFAVLHLVSPSSLAFGDVRFAGPLGAALGWWGFGALAAGVFAGFFLAAVMSVALIATGRATRRSPVPLGTYLAAGAILTIALVCV